MREVVEPGREVVWGVVATQRERQTEMVETPRRFNVSDGAL